MADETAQGIAAAGALKDAERKSMAYNALVQSYGPAAGDPQAWGQALSAQKAQAELPYVGQEAAAKLAQTQATTASTEAGTAQTQQQTKLAGNQAQREAQFRALKLLQSTGVDPQSGSVSPEAFDRIVGGNAETLGLDPAHAWPLKQALTAPGGAQHLDAMEQALIAPSQVSGAPVIARDEAGNTTAVRFDKYGNPITTQLQGLTTVQQQRADTGAAAQQSNAKLGAARVSIAQQNANTASAREGVYAANQPFASAGGAVGVPGTALGATGGAAPSASAAPLIDRLPLKGQLQVRSSAQGLVNNAQTIDTANTILDQIDTQLKPFTTGAGSLLNKLPGTLQNDLRANLQTIKAQGLQTWLQSMKNAQGQTGLGRVLQSEVQNAMSLYGNMEQDQTTTQLKFHLDLFRKAIARLNDNGRAAFQSTWKTSPEAAIGVPERGAAPAKSAPGGSPQFEEGKVYKDAKGNQARYQGGKWVEVQ